MTTSRGVRALEAAAVVLTAIGVALLVWPARTVSPGVAAAIDALPTSNASSRNRAEGEALAEQIVNTNLFSATRRAPRERFVLPGATPAMPDPNAYLLAPGATADASPVLYGIVTVDGTRRALLQLHPDSAPRVAAVGQRIAGYRVRTIGADRVELSSSSGTRVVRLSRAVPDSSGTLP